MVSLVLNVNLLLAYYPQDFARSGHLSENSIRDYALCFVLSQESVRNRTLYISGLSPVKYFAVFANNF